MALLKRADTTCYFVVLVSIFQMINKFKKILKFKRDKKVFVYIASQIILRCEKLSHEGRMKKILQIEKNLMFSFISFQHLVRI